MLIASNNITKPVCCSIVTERVKWDSKWLGPVQAYRFQGATIEIK